MILGLDVWEGYGPIDWGAVRAAGIRFVYVKCTDNTWTDPRFAEYADGARAAGLYAGAYHVLHPQSEIAAQLAHFEGASRGLGFGLRELPPAITCELPWPTHWASVGLSPRRALGAVVECVARIEDRWSRTPVIYSGAGWWSALGALPDAALARCPLWQAAYPSPTPVDPTTLATPKPLIPWSAATFWQYSGMHSQPVPGVRSPRCNEHPNCQHVDRDVFLGSEGELRRLARDPSWFACAA
jgi:GH25 family lysozyme M1 (1,4-beta-N-acetylmuramidase)